MYLILFLTKTEMEFLLKIEDQFNTKSLEKGIACYAKILGRRAFRWGCMGFIMGIILMTLIYMIA
jgi:hypothetical protein